MIWVGFVPGIPLLITGHLLRTRRYHWTSTSSLIRKRQREGISLAKARDTYRGRKRALAPEVAAELAARAAAGTPKSRPARAYGLGRETVYQYLRRGQSRAMAGGVKDSSLPA